MTFTAQMITADLSKVARSVWQAQEHCQECFDAYIALKKLRDPEHNVTYVLTTGTVAEREAVTARKMGDLEYEYQNAKLLYQHSLKMLKSKESLLSAAQSMASAKTKEMDAGLRFGPSQGDQL